MPYAKNFKKPLTVANAFRFGRGTGMKYYIGWDVGAWKCRKGKDDSCDAIVVMNDSGIIGFHRDNLGDTIRRLYDAHLNERHDLLVKEWFTLCGLNDQAAEAMDAQCYIAIDTPLGWPLDFRELLNGNVPVDWNYRPKAENIQNSLLFRYTERNKLKSGLSVIVDSIGSQSAKGILLLKLLAAKEEGWGVWKAGNLTLFETYPKACLVRERFVTWMSSLNLTQCLTESFKVQTSKSGEKPKKYGFVNVVSPDVFDAAVCACVARAFASDSPKLVRPNDGDDPIQYTSEGWIFYPDEPEATADQSIADGHSKVTCHESVTTFCGAIEAFQNHLRSKTKKQ